MCKEVSPGLKNSLTEKGNSGSQCLRDRVDQRFLSPSVETTRGVHLYGKARLTSLARTALISSAASYVPITSGTTKQSKSKTFSGSSTSSTLGHRDCWPMTMFLGYISATAAKRCRNVLEGCLGAWIDKRRTPLPLKG